MKRISLKGGKTLFSLIVLLIWSNMAMAAETFIEELALPGELSSPNAIAIDSSGQVWFTEKIGKHLAMYDPRKKTFKTYLLPSSWGKAGPAEIAIAPSGEIWFNIHRWAESDEKTNVLGKFMPADGKFIQYKLSVQASPEELIIDKHGVIWFSAAENNKLYRVNPKDGTVKGYPIPTANSYPRGLAFDQNGNIWFAEANANQIGKYDSVREVFYEYRIPTDFSNPGQIAIDSAGKVWFVELTANRIGVFYPDRIRFDEALIPTLRSLPNAIGIDNNGNVWFLEYRGNKIGVFNPAKARFSEYTIPSYNSLPGNLAIDHKNARLWFTQSNTESSKLGVLSMRKALEAAADKKQEASKPAPKKEQADNMIYWFFLSLILMIIIIGVFLKLSRNRRKSG